VNAQLPNAIIELVGKRYLKKDQPEVLRLLSEYQLNDEAYRERVLRCIISLAGRDMSKLLHFLECAREDARNLIYWYEHGEQSRGRFLNK
jgi:hypothetical protein